MNFKTVILSELQPIMSILEGFGGFGAERFPFGPIAGHAGQRNEVFQIGFQGPVASVVPSNLVQMSLYKTVMNTASSAAETQVQAIHVGYLPP